ncbi:hypothetical protein D3C85_1622370 [compost metagenome]
MLKSKGKVADYNAPGAQCALSVEYFLCYSVENASMCCFVIVMSAWFFSDDCDIEEAKKFFK